MADSNQELNELKIKSDSLPDNWLVTLVNPATGAVAENMTVARFIELLPFLSTSGGILKSAIQFEGTYSGASMLEDAADLMHIGSQMNSGFLYISYGVKYKLGTTDIISTIQFRENAIYFMYVFTNDGIYYAATDRTKIPVGTIVQNFTFRKIAGISNLSTTEANALTETVTKEIPVSANTPMTLEETGQPASTMQTVERYEYSIPKMAEMILSLRKELDELKGGTGKL